MATIGRNISFPIYSANGTPFNNLVLRKATVDSVVMSLSDKITGDVYYKNNHLKYTMQEYVVYNDIHYILVNPPTIVKEGLVKDNSDLKGMTKYSFEFYHPMYILSNLPFSDVAVSSDEQRYLSENKTFNWIGKPQDFINKINKNLEGTEWIVVKSDRFPVEKDNELSEVLQFDNNTIADALKTGYETWGLPYVVSQIRQVETHFSEGKRFKVEYGLPSNEILVGGSQEPFVFQFGKGVGLKNNSRTPRKNKIITRIAGYGSENNIPYGYPQIPWYGDQSATQTPDGYPVYKGIVGGRYINLIKHPFTRTHLMPSVYSNAVFNKVSPYLSDGTSNLNYNPNIELKDYYDAVYSVEYPYINEINLVSPSYEIHEFDIKPELEDGEPKTITSAIPLNTSDLSPADSWDDTMNDDGEYIQSYFQITLPQLDFDIYACAAITEEMQINMRSGACIGCTFPIQVDWEDYKKNFYDTDGNFVPDGEQRNLTKYPKSNLGSINIICQKEYNTFGTIMPSVYQQPKNGDSFVILGISLPLSYIRNAEQRLDDEMKSYMLGNNVYYYDYPLKFDEYFLVQHTDILEQIRPNTIIRFQFANDTTPLQLFVKQLTVKYNEDVLPQYDITLTDNIEVVLNQIGQVADDVDKLGSLISILRQSYTRSIWGELDKRLSKVKDDSTPHKLTMGAASVTGNATIAGDSSIGGNLEVGDTLWVTRDSYVVGNSRTLGNAQIDNTIRVNTAAQSGRESDGIVMGATEGDTAYEQNTKGCKIWWNGSGWMIETDYLSVNKRMYAKEVQVDEVTHVGGEQLLTEAACIADVVVPYKSDGTEAGGGDTVAYYRVFFRSKDSDGRAVYNRWKAGDQAYCQTFNIDEGTTHDFTNRYYWRLVVRRDGYPQGATYDEATTALLADHHFIDLSDTIKDESGDIRMDEHASSVPSPEDNIVQLGYRPSWTGGSGEIGDTTAMAQRQGATLVSGGGQHGRAIVMWEGVHEFSLPTPRVLISPQQVKMVLDELSIKTTGGDTQEIVDYVTEQQPSFEIFQLQTNAVPTTSSEPFTSWTANEKEKYSTYPNNAVVLNSDGRTWRFEKNDGAYSFVEFTDPWLLAQHYKIEDILDDNVITADEHLQLQNWWKAMFSNDCVDAVIIGEYSEFGQTKPQPVVAAYGAYDTAAEVLTSDLYYNNIFAPNAATPIYLSGYNGEQSVTKKSISRADLQNAIDSYNLAVIGWQGVYALYKAKAEAQSAQTNAQNYVTQNINTIAGDTIDNHIKTSVDNSAGEINKALAALSASTDTKLSSKASQDALNTTNGNVSHLDTRVGTAETNIGSHTQQLTHLGTEIAETNDGITAVNDWIGVAVTEDPQTGDKEVEVKAGTSGMITHLNELFVGTSSIKFEVDNTTDPPQVIYYDSADRRLYKDNGGVYYYVGETKTYIPGSTDKEPSDYGDPHIVNTNKAGLVTTEGFASLFVQEVDDEGIAKTAHVATMIEDGIGQASISADQVFIKSGSREKGMSNLFELNGETGDVTMHDLFAHNITVEGVINNEVITLKNMRANIIPGEQGFAPSEYNLEDYFYLSRVNSHAAGDTLSYYFDPLAIGSVIDASRMTKPINLIFPCLWRKETGTAYTLYGIRYLGKDADGISKGRHYSVDDLRQCIGKKFYIKLGTDGDNPTQFLYLFTGKEYVAIDPPPALFRKASTFDPQGGYYNYDWYYTPDSNIYNNYAVVECKLGIKNSSYCIYWDITDLIRVTYTPTDSIINGNGGALPQTNTDVTDETD